MDADVETVVAVGAVGDVVAEIVVDGAVEGAHLINHLNKSEIVK